MLWVFPTLKTNYFVFNCYRQIYVTFLETTNSQNSECKEINKFYWSLKTLQCWHGSHGNQNITKVTDFKIKYRAWCLLSKSYSIHVRVLIYTSRHRIIFCMLNLAFSHKFSREPLGPLSHALLQLTTFCLFMFIHCYRNTISRLKGPWHKLYVFLTWK